MMRNGPSRGPSARDFGLRPPFALLFPIITPPVSPRFARPVLAATPALMVTFRKLTAGGIAMGPGLKGDVYVHRRDAVVAQTCINRRSVSQLPSPLPFSMPMPLWIASLCLGALSVLEGRLVLGSPARRNERQGRVSLMACRPFLCPALRILCRGVGRGDGGRLAGGGTGGGGA